MICRTDQFSGFYILGIQVAHWLKIFLFSGMSCRFRFCVRNYIVNGIQLYNIHTTFIEFTQTSFHRGYFNSYIHRNIAIVRTFKTKADFIFTKIKYFSFVVKVYGSQSELFHVVQVHANSPKTSKGLLLTQNMLEFCLKQ